KYPMPWRGTMNDEFAGAIPGEARWLYGPEKKMKIEHLPILPAPLGNFWRNKRCRWVDRIGARPPPPLSAPPIPTRPPVRSLPKAGPFVGIGGEVDVGWGDRAMLRRSWGEVLFVL